ncbi:MAG: ABC transporter permease [Spiribacter salinus]|uniref:ABC transporter permease n=1 Tax=Spiribacter salinus TaxID=1335746 RepID=A0A540VT42_9GAMM|nr:MAG: ABC transporter permease [Spiribacter salinus]
MRSVTRRRLSTGAWILGIGAALVYITLPAVVVVLAAFNERAILSFPPQEWSLRWFVKAVSYNDFQDGFVNGLIVTAWASTIAVVVGSTFAYAIDRLRFPGRDALETLLLSPLVIPHFTIGLGFLILASQLSMARSFTVVVITHVVLVLPFVLRSVYVSLQNLDVAYEKAAESLGASPGRVMRHVTIPLLAPGLFGGWLFAAVISFNEFTASLFVTGHRTQTLPVAMYTYVREYTDPTIAAISALFIGVTAVILIVANRFLGLGRVLAIEEVK